MLAAIVGSAMGDLSDAGPKAVGEPGKAAARAPRPRSSLPPAEHGSLRDGVADGLSARFEDFPGTATRETRGPSLLSSSIQAEAPIAA